MELVSFILQFLLASGIIFLAVYIPGWLWLRQVSWPMDFLERTVASVILGMVLFTLIQFGLGYAGLLSWLWLYVALGVLGFIWTQVRLWQKIGPAAFQWHGIGFLPEYGWLIGLLALAVLLQGSLHFGSGWKSSLGAVYQTFHGHDAPWHVYNIYQFSRRFPVEMPGFAGELLRNYHFLSDLFWGGIKRLAPSLDPQHIYFRIAPVFHSLGLSLSMFIAARRISGSARIGVLAVALNVFTAGFGYLLPLFTGQHYLLWESVFWLSPPFSLLFNPGVASSLYLVLAGLWGFQVYQQTRKNTAGLFTGLVWGTVIGFKVYAGLVIVAGLLGLGLWSGWRHKNFIAFKTLGWMVPVSLAVFLPVNSSSVSLVKILPGYALATMIAAPDRMNLISFDLLKAMWLHQPVLFAGLFLLLAFIFVIGNLGVKTMGLLPLARAVLHPRPADSSLIFIAWASTASLAAPLLLAQYGVQWQTIQFGYYAVLLLAIPAAIELQRWLEKITSPQQKLVLALCFLAGIPCVVQTVLVMRWTYSISPAEIEAWRFLRSTTSPAAVILRPLIPELQTAKGQAQLQQVLNHGKMVSLSDFQAAARRRHPSPLPPTRLKSESAFPLNQTMRSVNAAYVAGWTQRNTFLEDVVSAQIMGYPVEQRLQAVARFFQARHPHEAKKFLREQGITHVVLFAADQLPAAPANLGLALVFKNNQVSIFRLVKE